MATRKLYDEMPYETEFEGRIEEIRESGQETLFIVLDATLFFPEEGGQSSDLGELLGCPVTHVSIKDGVITHEVKDASGILKEGDTVKGKIDWDHRFSNMQNHTAEHILSGILFTRWQSLNVGFHLSDHVVTLDTSKELTAADLKALEREANEAVYRNLPLTCRYYSPIEAARMEYRSKKEIQGEIRLVTIPGIDICACCAPHVSRTGEIGVIRIVKAERHRGGMRLTILAGRRAYQYLSEMADLAEDLSRSLSVGTERLKDKVDSLRTQNEELLIRIKNHAAETLLEKIRRISPEESNAVLFIEPVDSIVQRNAVNELSKRGNGIFGVFASDEKEGYRFYLSFPGSDAREVMAVLKETLGARGGGSPEMVQGSVKASEEEIRRCIFEAQGQP